MFCVVFVLRKKHQESAFTLMTVAKMAYIVILEDAFLVWTGKWIIVGYLLCNTSRFSPVFNWGEKSQIESCSWLPDGPDPMNSFCYYECRAGEVYYASDASHGTYETRKILFFFQKFQLHIYIYIFFFLDTIVFQTFEVYIIVIVLLSWGNVTN